MNNLSASRPLGTNCPNCRGGSTVIQCGRQRLLFYFSSPFTRSIYFCTSICGFPVQYRREGGRAPCSPQVKLTDKQ